MPELRPDLAVDLQEADLAERTDEQRTVLGEDPWDPSAPVNSLAQLRKAYKDARVAVTTGAALLERFPNTPYTRGNAETTAAAAQALNLIGRELREMETHTAKMAGMHG